MGEKQLKVGARKLQRDPNRIRCSYYSALLVSLAGVLDYCDGSCGTDRGVWKAGPREDQKVALRRTGNSQATRVA
jgi:hypothetical protein